MLVQQTGFMTKPHQLFAWSACVVVMTAHAAPMKTYVVDSFNADALVSVIRPLLAKGGYVNSYQGKLVVRTTAENYATLQHLLTQVDTAPKQLKISMRVKAHHHSDNRSVSVNDVVITRNEQGKWGVGADIDVDYENTRHHDHTTFTINTLSGYTARIDSGTLHALSQPYLSTYGVATHTSWVPITQGVHILPTQLPNGQIKLSISQQHDRMNKARSARHSVRIATQGVRGDDLPYRHNEHRQHIDTQHTQTQVVVQPHQWVSVGSIVQSRTTSRSLGHASERVAIPIEVRVD